MHKLGKMSRTYKWEITVGAYKNVKKSRKNRKIHAILQ